MEGLRANDDLKVTDAAVCALELCLYVREFPVYNSSSRVLSAHNSSSTVLSAHRFNCCRPSCALRSPHIRLLDLRSKRR